MTLNNVGAIVAMVFIAVALFWLWKPGIFSSGQSISILGFATGTALVFGLYVFHLRGRIIAIEKRLRELP